MLVAVLSDEVRVFLKQAVEIHEEVAGLLLELSDDSLHLRKRLQRSTSERRRQNDQSLTGIECEWSTSS